MSMAKREWIWFALFGLVLVAFTFRVTGGTFGAYCDNHGCVDIQTVLATDGRGVELNGVTRISWPDTTSQYMIQTGAQTWTNMPTVATELTGNYRTAGDLTEKDEVRFGATTAIAGSTNAKIYIQYSFAGNNWFNLSRNDSTLSIATTGVVQTGWEDLPIITKVSGVQFRVMGVGGDGVADPQFRGVWIEVR